MAARRVLSQRRMSLPFFSAKTPYDSTVQIDTHRTSKPECLVVRKHRRLEGVPSEDEKRRGGIEIGIGLQMRQLLQAPTLDFAPRHVQRIFWRGGIRIPFLLEQDLLGPAAPFLGNLPRRAAL